MLKSTIHTVHLDFCYKRIKKKKNKKTVYAGIYDGIGLQDNDFRLQKKNMIEVIFLTK